MRFARNVGFIIVLFALSLFGAPQQNPRTRSPLLSRPSMPATQAPRPRKAVNPRVLKAYGTLPMRFEENRGQTDPHVQFLARGAGYSLFLTASEAVLALHAPRHISPGDLKMGKRRLRQPETAQRQDSLIRMKLSGASPATRLSKMEPLPGTTNYIVGRDSKKWRTGMHSFAKVQYADVYPGIDLVYYGNQRHLEYDFVVKPGAKPEAIGLEFEGAEQMALSPAGDLSLTTKASNMTLRKPTIYQVVNGRRQKVDGAYHVKGHMVGVDVAPYDRTRPLVIDPVLSYSTYLGGTGDDVGFALAVDPQGNAYVAGITSSIDFPMVGPAAFGTAPVGHDTAFVTKLNSAGTALVYSTYLGGTQEDSAYAIALDTNANAYVTGFTASPDFPVTANAFQSSLVPGAADNVFLTKLSADGQSLLYSTYLGGRGQDVAIGITVDPNQNAYITGETTSGSPSPFPTTANAFQTSLNSPGGNAFVTRIDTTLSGAASLVYSTYLGGTTTTGWDQGSDITVDANANAYIAGQTCSTDFPITQSAYQRTGNPNCGGFLTQIDTTQVGSAALKYSTYFGGASNTVGEGASGVLLDADGKVYISGFTSSLDFPATTGFPNSQAGKAFVAKFDTTQSGASSLWWSRLIGGSRGDIGMRIALDPNGNVYLAGFTFSPDFPATPDAIQSSPGNNYMNGFVSGFSPDGSILIYSTYWGGSGATGDWIASLAFDSASNIYIAGQASSSDLPTTPGAWSTTFAGATDAFVAKLSAAPGPMITSVWPQQGGVGASVTLYGSSFGDQQNGSTVTINGVAVQPTYWSNWQINLTVPQITNSGPVEVTVGGVHSNPMPFQFVLASRANPQSVYISPDEVSLSVGDLRQLRLVDTQGNEVTDAAWSVNDTSVADLTFPPGTPTDVSTSPSLEGVGPGQATITATSSLGSAQAIARVYPSGPLPTGSTAWSVYPDTSNNWFSSVVQGMPMNAGDPGLYLTEQLSTGGASIRALDQGGQQLWRKYFDQRPQITIATPDGGLVAQIGPAMMKFSGAGDALWTLPDSGGFGPAAVSFGDTIYGYSSANGQFGAFDATSGNLRYAVTAVPMGLLTVSAADHNDNPTCASKPTYPLYGVITPLVVATNGKAYFTSQVQNATFVSDGACDFSQISTGDYQQTTDTSLVELTPQGAGTVTPIYHDVYTGRVWSFSPPVLFEPYDCGAIQFNSFCNERISETLARQAVPDGAGGVLVTLTYRPPDATQPDQDSLIRAVDGGVAYSIPPPGLASGYSVAGAGFALTDDNAAILSPFQALNAVKFDPVTGTVLWSTPVATNGDNIYVQNATDDGGVMLQDVLYGSDGSPTTTLMQLDPNGTQTASTNLSKDLSNLTTLYLSAGHLLIQDPNTSALQDFPLPNFPSSPGLTFPIIGIGNNSKTKAARDVSVRESTGSSPMGCTGFDDKYNALMVPQTPNSNALRIKANRGHDVTLALSGSNVSFSPGLTIPGDGQFHDLTVSGGSSTVGTFQINAYSNDGTLLGTPFQIDVKPHLNRTLRFFTISDPEGPPVGPLVVPANKVPTQASLQAELDRIFPRQTNVQFSVIAGGDFSYHYDTDGDGAMHYDVTSDGKECYACIGSGELNGLIVNFFSDPVRFQWQTDPSNFFAFYVNKISKKDVLGMSAATKNYDPAVVAAIPDQPSTPVNHLTENVTAHEMGHILGEGGTFTVAGNEVTTDGHNWRMDAQFLMLQKNPNITPCRISRNDWNIMNFTQGTLIIPKEQ